jgi:hypothetical protein
MAATSVRERLENALTRVLREDRYLLENDLSERCIASRLAMYLQEDFPDFSVDVEYNKDGVDTKMLGIPEHCANRRNEDGEASVVPDVIVHRRGSDGPNILLVELKKTSNLKRPGCDLLRVQAFRAQFAYRFGALIECETRRGRKPGIRVTEWFDDPAAAHPRGNPHAAV